MKGELLIVGARPWNVLLPRDLSRIQVELALFERRFACINTNQERSICVGTRSRVLPVRVHRLRVHYRFAEVITPSSKAVCFRRYASKIGGFALYGGVLLPIEWRLQIVSIR